jgi:hypothetical protein
MSDALNSLHRTSPADDTAPVPLVARLPDLTSRTTAEFILAQTAAPREIPSLTAPASPIVDWRDVAIRYLSAAVLVVGMLAITVQWRYHRISAQTARQQIQTPDRPPAPPAGEQP